MQKGGTSIGNACIRDVDTDVISIKDTCARRAFTDGAYTGSICAKVLCIKSAFKKGACVGTVCAIERSKMHLQSFSILEVKLFNTG